jgi:hypothetical protein
VLGNAGYRFTDPFATQDGLTRVLLRPLPSDPGSKIVFKGPGARLSLPGLPLPAGDDVVVQVHNSTTDSCWGAAFDASEVVRNDGIAFKAIHLE